MTSADNPLQELDVMALIEISPETSAPSDLETDRSCPVSLLPTEILQLVFEHFVLTSSASSRFKNSVLLSGVCRRWRWTAVETPSLWATLDLDLLVDVEPGDKIPLLDLAVTRMKSVPATITICGITQENVNENLRQIFTLPQLSTLKLLFWQVLSPDLFLEDFLRAVKYKELQELSLKGSRWGLEVAVPSLVLPFKAFPSLTHLSLSHMGRLDLKGLVSKRLASFDARHISEVDLEQVLQAFPYLERLRIQSTRIIDDSCQQPKTMPYLRHLVAMETSLFRKSCISTLHCPKLVNISEGYAPSDSTLEFLRRHPTVKRLNVFLEGRQIAAFATAAPQLTSICLISPVRLFVHWREAGLASPSFPGLVTVRIDGEAEPLSQGQFEELVRARFLPFNHPQSQLEDPGLHVQTLNILSKSNVSWKAEDWASHPLCAEAIKQVRPCGETGDWFLVSLRWI